MADGSAPGMDAGAMDPNAGMGGGDYGDFRGGGGGRGGGADRNSRGFRGTAENSKTKLCMRWMSPEGCRFGDRCNFAHGEHELRKLPPRQAGPGGRGPRDNGGRGYGGGWQDGFGDNRGPGFDDFYRGGYGGMRPQFPGGPGGFPGGPGGFPGQMPGAGMPGNGGPPGGMGPMGGQALGGGMPPGGRGAPHESVENIAWIASGCPVTGPGSWTQYRCADSGEYYYHNQRTNQTTWDKPAEWGS